MTFAEFKDGWLLVSPLAGPLLGVVAGGCITWFITRASEKRKRKADREDKKKEAARIALTHVVQWAVQLEDALKHQMMHLELIAMRAPGMRIPEQRDNVTSYRSVIPSITQKPVPAEYRVFLTERVTQLISHIVKGSILLEPHMILLEQWAERNRDHKTEYEDASKKCNQLKIAAAELVELLNQQILATYD